MDQTARLAQITVPSLIIWGDRDQVLPLQNATLLAQGLVNSKKVVLKDIGHVPMLEAWKQVAALCSGFLSAPAPALVRGHALPLQAVTKFLPHPALGITVPVPQARYACGAPAR